MMTILQTLLYTPVRSQGRLAAQSKNPKMESRLDV